jgi:hypothetical protein
VCGEPSSGGAPFCSHECRRAWFEVVPFRGALDDRLLRELDEFHRSFKRIQAIHAMRAMLAA